MSIHDIAYKIKGRVGIDHITLINIIVIVLVGICAFGLGRLSAGSAEIEESIKIIDSQNTLSRSTTKTYIDNNTEQKSTELSQNGKYVASKNGKLYYTSNCTGVKRIKEENKVWFDTQEEAEKAGFTLSSSCK
jgi:hypothetical protein